ncbi:MAG: M48 family metalloprotease [Deltaproteobacteria bacterium]|nr:M48 family metalloprotease [Deltaproteobacteria bacterium]
MRQRTHHAKRLFTALLLVLLSWVVPSGVPHALALSIEDEREMGEEFLRQIGSQYEMVKDPFANQYINDLGHYLLAPLEVKNFPFHFYIIKDNTLNAFAAPAGHIFFFSGLVEALDEVDELAAVICHEIGHVSARHLAHRIEQSKKIGLATLAGVLAGVLLGGEAAGALITGSMAAGMQAQLHYSREDERQADQLSFKYMGPATFDPAGMIRALQKIQKGSWLGTDKVPAYLLTHPTGPERMSNLDSLLTRYTPPPRSDEAEAFETRWPAFKTVIRALCLDPADAERIFNRELKENPDAPLPHFGLGIVAMKASRYELAVRELKRAEQGKPDFIPILRKLGEAYELNGQGQEALKVLEKALALNRGDRDTLFVLGTVYESMGKNQAALKIFERLSYLTPVRYDVYYHLGLCYGREKELALAHYNFGVYFLKLGQFSKARFHLEKAKELAGKNPALKSKILKKLKELEGGGKTGA